MDEQYNYSNAFLSEQINNETESKMLPAKYRVF